MKFRDFFTSLKEKAKELLFLYQDKERALMNAFLIKMQEAVFPPAKEEEKDLLEIESDEKENDCCIRYPSFQTFRLEKLKGHEKAVFDYIAYRISSSHMDDDCKNYQIAISASEFQNQLHLSADQISRVLWKLSYKKILQRKGYVNNKEYFYQITVPVKILNG